MRFYIVDPDGDVVQTDNEGIAKQYAMDEDYIVIDSKTEALVMGDDTFETEIKRI